MKEKGHRCAGGKEGGGELSRHGKQARKKEKERQWCSSSGKKRMAVRVWNSFQVSTACGKDGN
jgi:hypothetical protein